MAFQFQSFPSDVKLMHVAPYFQLVVQVPGGYIRDLHIATESCPIADLYYGMCLPSR